MEYHLITYGCQMNKSDSLRIASLLNSIGYKKTEKVEEANLLIINMCSVRESAVNRVRGLVPKIREIKKNSKKTKTILTGCILPSDKKFFEENFDIVIGINNIPKLPRLLGVLDKKNISDYFKIEPEKKSYPTAYIPIMTGCNNFCSYCVVPYTRGRETSRKAEEIIKEAKLFIQSGYKEIWLLGQNVNSYSDKNLKFPDILKKVNEIPGDFWIRFTSSHPKDFSPRLIKILKECKKVCEYLNLPVQSGDNEILKKMNRPYTIEKYKNIIKKVREAVPDISISTDIIVGFPGETKKQFKNTKDLIKEMAFEMGYISKYSVRKGSAAEKMEDNITSKEKKKREKILNEIIRKINIKKNKKYIGKKLRVLIDSKKNEYHFGKTRTNKTVKIKSSKKILGKFANVEIIDSLPWGLKAKLIDYEE